MKFPSEVPTIHWVEPPGDTVLHPGEVHVWRVKTDRDADFPADPLSLLSKDEAERAGRFHFEKDRRRFARCRVTLRQIAGAYIKKDPQEVEFSYQEKGKPELILSPDSPALHFNLSHSGEIALLAFDLAYPLGIDLEAVQERTDIESIAERYFSPAELVDLPVELPHRRQAFFTLWTLKEAYLKARGSGLSYPLNAFKIGRGQESGEFSLQVPQDPGQNARWSLFGFVPQPGFQAGLATDPSISNKYFFEARVLQFSFLHRT